MTYRIGMGLTVALCFLIPLEATADNRIQLKIAAIDWCPQLCLKQQKPGYIRELVERIYDSTEYKLEISTYPWSRALTMVRQGRVDAVLSPAKAEAPDLKYPETEVGIQRMCFFTLSTNPWQYNGLKSLAGLQFGVATDTSLEELNEYAAQHPIQFQRQPYHERYILQQAQKLRRGRIDAFLFTYNSTRYELQQNGQWQDFKSVGCVSNAKVYMAFTPKREMQSKTEHMIKQFDQRMKTLEQTDTPAEIMRRYGLEYWKGNN